MNASTIDPGSPVETSVDLRQLTEDKMNQTQEEFLMKHTEHAQRLDELAGELQSLDLSEISHKVGGFRRLVKHVTIKLFKHLRFMSRCLLCYSTAFKTLFLSGIYRYVAVHQRVRTRAHPLPVGAWAAPTLRVSPSVEVKGATVS